MRGLTIILQGMLLAWPLTASSNGLGSHGDWTIGSYRLVANGLQEGAANLKLSHRGETVYQINDHRIEISFHIPNNVDPPSGAFISTEDLDLGSPAVWVQSYSGGAHCCWSSTLIILGDAPEIIDPIEGYERPQIRSDAQRRDPVCIVLEDVFAYWRTDWADSPSISVPLRLDRRQRRFMPDVELMRLNKSLSGDLQEKAAKAGREHSDAIAHKLSIIPVELSAPMIELIYSGRISDARKFLEMAWAGADAARDEYWQDLTECQMRKSRYWPAVAELNGLPAAEPNCKPQ